VTGAACCTPLSLTAVTELVEVTETARKSAKPIADQDSSFHDRLRPLQLAELLDDGLIVRHLSVKNEDVVYVKGIFEASEGLCAMFAERGGNLTIVAPASRSLELDVLLRDLAGELGGVLDAGGC
jgi:hypothetical protein